ncbi:diguanylate cyclase [Aquabacterium sp.]|uniref:sensor domain-containing protein n=1 Tax=Aquabacterium sp. TaxID=1872578 RepID=UPI0025BA0E16|nr:diguanylate cyclase [Aquabacterium sp.]
MSFITSMRMGTPTRPLSAPASPPRLRLAIPLIGLIAGLALTSSHHPAWQWVGVSLSLCAAWAGWRARPATRGSAGGLDDAVWQAWLEGSQDAVMVLTPRHDPLGRFMGHMVAQANAPAQALFLPDGLALVGQRLQDVLPAGMPESFHERLHMAWEGRQPQVDEHALHPGHALGQGEAPRWLSHQMIPLPGGVALISRDTSAAHHAIEALHEQESFYRCLVDHLPMAVFARSARAHNAGRYVVWNREAAEVMQLSAEQVLGKRPEDILPPEMVERGRALDQALAQQPRVHHFPNLIYQTPQGPRVVDLIKAPIYGVDGQLDHILSIAQDVTVQRQAADQLRLASRVIDETGDAVMVTDAMDRVVMVNPAFLRMSGLRHHEVIGHDAELLGLAPLRETHLIGVQETLRGGPRWAGESPLVGPDGLLLETWLSVSVLRNEAQQVTQHIRVFNDISRLKAQQRELTEQARRDSLTGLPNRREFSDRLRLAMARARRQPQTLALMYVDLDGFKAINDQLGHAAGDRLLVEVARRMEDCVRTTDCVCRLSGDEFTVILEGAGHPDEVTRIANRIIERLAQPCQIDAHTVQARASLGAALWARDEDLDALCQRADTAMYAAKHAGKGRFVLDTAGAWGAAGTGHAGLYVGAA